jgi:anti-anti-sigma regulatory factor
MPDTGEQGPARATLRLAKRFDYRAHVEFRRSAESFAPGQRVTVDFADTTYIDSAALGMLLLLGERLGDARLVHIVNATGQPREILELANLHLVFDLS